MVYKFVDVTNDEDINSLIFGLLLHYGFVLSVCSENTDKTITIRFFSNVDGILKDNYNDFFKEAVMFKCFLGFIQELIEKNPNALLKYLRE